MLHKWVYERDLAKMEENLRNGADPNVRNRRKETPLHFAAYHGRNDFIGPLIRAGAKPDKFSVSHCTPLMMAAMQGRADTARALIDMCREVGAPFDINAPNVYGETALHFAASFGFVEVIDALLAAGANVDSADCEGHTPLDLAIAKNRPEAVTRLTQCGANRGKVVTPEMPQKGNVPACVEFGCIVEPLMQGIEEKFGGAPWCDCLEVFYSGKKPKVGYCIEISLILKMAGVSNALNAVLLGIISRVSDDKKRITATVKLNFNSSGFFPQLQGEWEATLEWCSQLENPWFLTELVPRQDPEKSFDKLKEKADELERQRGRKVDKVVPNFRTVILEGEDLNSFARVLVNAELSVSNASLKLKYQDGGEEILSDPSRSTLIFKDIIARNMALKAQGKPGITVQMNGIEAVPIGEGDVNLDLN